MDLLDPGALMPDLNLYIVGSHIYMYLYDRSKFPLGRHVGYAYAKKN